MIAAYLRISTDSQKTDLQRKEIQAWAETHDMEELIWYEDKISSKSTKDS